LSPLSSCLLALQKEEEGDDNVVAVPFLHYSVTKEEEEGDDSIAAVAFFVYCSVA
jgi:hypothetical protein